MTGEHYPPLGRSIRTVSQPKPGGGERRLHVLGPREAAAYTRAVSRVAPAIERRLGPEVFANRAPGAGSLEPWRRARSRWRRAAADLLSGPVVTMDVVRCYDLIAPEVVGAALEASGASHADGEEIVRLLRLLRDAGVEGIPVGPDPSAVLANAVLAAVDETLRRDGFRFVRWVDDLVISGPGSRDLGAGELAVESALARIGLTSNAAKHHRFEDPEMAGAFVLREGGGSGLRP
ncbi:MAG: hypothetical protein QOG88_774 [Actinomycetota bacterium]|nr:hypothetical protein [Actinomycetota bacterium]